MKTLTKKFIAFEGIDGCGKSTQARLLSNRLIEKGESVYLTSEPTSRPIGKMIREIFAHRMEADDRTIAALFVADRLDHLTNSEDGLLSKIKNGFTVICDRYYLSSYTYQGSLVSLDWVIQANALSVSLLKPDVHIFIDIPVELAIERIANSRTQIERYETIENLKRVRKSYFEIIEQLKAQEHIVIVDGMKEMAWIADRIWEEINY